MRAGPRAVGALRAAGAAGARAMLAAAGLAWLAGGAAARTAPDAPAAPAEKAQEAVAPAVPDAGPGEVAVRLAASGAVAAEAALRAPADDAHLCATLALDGGRRDTLLRFGADSGAGVLDPAGTGLVLTVAGPGGDGAAAGDGAERDAPAGFSGREGSVQVAIGGQVFFGSTQPGAPFRLALSEGRDGGRFVARHLTDRSGRQSIDLAGAWRCADAAASVATPPAASPDPATAPVAADAGPAGPAAPPAEAPGTAAPDTDGSPAPAAPGLPPATAFRELLTELDRSAPAAPEPARVPPPAAAPAPPGPARIAPPPVAVADPAFAGRRVFIHYRAGSRRGAAVADDLARTLDPQFARTVIRAVAATPDAAEVRYAHAGDAAAAGALARRLGAGWRVRGFTALAGGSEPGALEVWVPER